MREATGQAGLMNIMLVIIGIIIILLAGSIAYSKAFRVKNKIIDIIERTGKFDNDSKAEIETALSHIGYRVIDNSQYTSQCDQNKFKDSGFNLDTNVYPGYLYCIYKSVDNLEGTYYYKVVSFMYFDIPVIGSFIKIPVTGETKILYSNSSDNWKTVQ